MYERTWPISSPVPRLNFCEKGSNFRIFCMLALQVLFSMRCFIFGLGKQRAALFAPFPCANLVKKPVNRRFLAHTKAGGKKKSRSILEKKSIDPGEIVNRS